jgi:hypothetical protein
VELGDLEYVMRALPLLILFACEPGSIAVDGLDAPPGEGWATDAWATELATAEDPEDVSMWNGARIEVISPEPGSFLDWGATTVFEAQIVAADGTIMPFDDVEWSSDTTPNWYEQGARFESSDLPIGSQDFNAIATLPNGAVVQHTIGGVLVQHPFGGTYVGLLDVDGTLLNLPVSCTGVTVVIVDQFGTEGTGDGDCIVSLLGIDLSLHYIYELEIDALGVVGGTAGADLLGWFTYNFPAVGTVDPLGSGLDLTFEGEVPLMGPLNGATVAERVSLNSQP